MRLPLAIVLFTVSAAAAAQPTVAAPAYKVIDRLALGGAGGWDYLSFDAQRHHLFVSRGERVLVIDVDTLKQIGVIPATHGVHGIAIAQDLRRGFTSNGKANAVTVFDLDSLKTLATIGVTGANPDAIVYDTASHHVLTFNGKSGNASVVDPAVSKVIGTIALPGKPEFSVADGQGHVYVNLEDKSELAQIDTRSDKVIATWPLAPCTSPSGLAMDVAHKRLFSVCDNRVMVVLDATDGHRVATLPIGDGPDAATFDPAESIIYSSNGESGTLTMVHEDDPDHYSVMADVPTRISARTHALDPQTHRVYLSSAALGKANDDHDRPAALPGSFAILVVGRSGTP